MWRLERPNQICNYCKKLGHIKADWCTHKSKNEKAQRVDRKRNRQEEVNNVGSSVEVLTDNPNILFIENTFPSRS